MRFIGKPKKTIKSGDKSKATILIIVFQIIAWLFALNPLISPFTGSGPAGNGLGQGLSIFLITVPCMFFIFISNFYFAFKNDLKKGYRFLAVANYLGLIILFKTINW